MSSWAPPGHTWDLLQQLVCDVLGHVPGPVGVGVGVGVRVKQLWLSLSRANTLRPDLEPAIAANIRQRLVLAANTTDTHTHNTHAQAHRDGLHATAQFDFLCAKLRHMDKRVRTSMLYLLEAMTAYADPSPASLRLRPLSSSPSLRTPRTQDTNGALVSNGAGGGVASSQGYQTTANGAGHEPRAGVSRQDTGRSLGTRQDGLERSQARDMQPTRSEHDRFVDHEIERNLIRDLLFIFQGIDGKYIRYHPESKIYVLDPRLPLPIAVRDMVLEMCELGWLYKLVQEYIHRSENAQVMGMVGQAFGFALEQELSDYYRLLAVLESQLSPAFQDPPALIDRQEGLTLTRVFVWVQDPIGRMCLIATLTDAAGLLKGGALASSLHARGRDGDPYVRSFVRRLMSKICAPIFQMIGRWVFEGELDDPENEFFVRCKAGVDNSNMWHERYSIDGAMLPRFIPSKLAYQILVIGKSINFLRHCCEDSTVPQAVVEASPESFNSSLQSLQYGQDLHLENLATNISTITDNRLLRTMMGKYKLGEHLRMLKKFMLLGQGDFITSLMDSFGPDLNKLASNCQKPFLNNMLQTALRASTAQSEDGDLLDRVEVDLLVPNPMDKGWDVFVLTYNIDSPITAVVHTTAMKLYTTIFKFLWHVKRVEWSLICVWRNTMAALHEGLDTLVPEARDILHRSTLQRGRMLHLVSNLSNYMMFEVLETTWTELSTRISAASRLDDVIAAHDDYLCSVMRRAFLLEDTTALKEQLGIVFNIVLNFCVLQEELIGDLRAEAHRRRISQIHTNLAHSRSRASEPGNVVRISSRDRLEKCIEQYDSEFSILMQKLLKQSSMSSSDEMRFLTFRLDFNAFYSTRTTTQDFMSKPLLSQSTSTSWRNFREQSGERILEEKSSSTPPRTKLNGTDLEQGISTPSMLQNMLDEHSYNSHEVLSTAERMQNSAADDSQSQIMSPETKQRGRTFILGESTTNPSLDSTPRRRALSAGSVRGLKGRHEKFPR